MLLSKRLWFWIGSLVALRVLALPVVVSADGHESSLIQASELLKIQQLSSVALSPDGERVAYVVRSVVAEEGDEGEGEAPRLVTDTLDRRVNNFAWGADSSRLYLVAPSTGGFPLVEVPLSATGGMARLTSLETGIRSFDVGETGLAFVQTEVANPFELYGADLTARKPEALTHHNSSWLADKELSFPTAHRLTRPDGLEIDYWVMKPTRFEEGAEYPLLLENHGGPMAMWGPGEATMWHEFQLYAAKGYGIVYANQRGSGGRGLDFRKANFQTWGAGPSGDALAAASEAAKADWVDRDLQVVTGGSYAGYLTAWILGHDRRFPAAVAQRGVYDLPMCLGDGNAWRLVPWHFGGYPWEEEARELLIRESPLTYVAGIETPLLILHGDNDLRTGVIQSEVLYKRLKILEKPVKYVRYPSASHDLSRSGDPHQRLDRLLRIFEFLARYAPSEESWD